MCSPRTATRSTIAPVSPSPYRLVQRRVRRRRVGPPLRQPILGLELGPLRIEHLQKCCHPFAESQARQLGGALARGARFRSRSTRTRAVRYRVRAFSISSIAASTTRLYSARPAASRACAATTSARTRPRLSAGQLMTGPTK